MRGMLSRWRRRSSVLYLPVPLTSGPMTAFHPTARFPRGFRCASRNVGLKPEAKDLTLFVSEVDAAAAAAKSGKKG